MITDTKNIPVDDSDIIDLELKEIRKKKFRLERDNNRVIELNTSDLMLGKRLKEVYPKMLSLVTEANEIMANLDEEDDSEIEALVIINDKLKDFLNYVFDSDIADKACPDGSLYDPFNGKFRFEYIIEKLMDLYENNFSQEYMLMQKRIDKHTDKYTKTTKSTKKKRK